MTKKRRKPLSKKPPEASAHITARPPGNVPGHPGWNNLVAAVAARQTAAGSRDRPDTAAGPSAAPAPLPRPKPTPGPARPMGPHSVAAQTDPRDPALATAPDGAAVADTRRRGVFDALEPQGLAATYWIDTDTWEGPGDLSVRFSGSRADGDPGSPAERFEKYEDVDSITPGTGRIAVTTRVPGISAGTWQVAAALAPRAAKERPRADAELPETAQVATVRTRFDPLAQGPGVHVASWPLLVGLGAVLAVVLQAMFLAGQGIEPAGPVWLTLLANAVGGMSARVWWLALHRQPLKNFVKAGACIQGFLTGALATIVLGALAFGWPVGRILDAAAAGLFFGMAVGRPGCFFTGCCSGRPTSSRWGLWSSDRRLGRRRHPVQLYEAFLALLIGLGTLPFLLAAPPAIPGLVFVGSAMVYTIGRQLLFPLRVDPRTRRGRILTILVCALILAADIVLALRS